MIPEPLRPLFDDLRTDNYQRREQAIERLSECPDALPTLIDLIDDRSVIARIWDDLDDYETQITLGETAQTVLRRVGAPALPALCAALPGRVSQRPLLEKLIEDFSRPVRAPSQGLHPDSPFHSVLNTINNQFFLPDLIAALRRADMPPNRALIGAIAHHRTPEAIAALREVLRRCAGWDTEGLVAEALVRLQGAEALDALLAVLDDHPGSIDILEAAAAFNTPAVLDALERGLYTRGAARPNAFPELRWVKVADRLITLAPARALVVFTSLLETTPRDGLAVYGLTRLGAAGLVSLRAALPRFASEPLSRNPDLKHRVIELLLEAYGVQILPEVAEIARQRPQDARILGLLCRTGFTFTTDLLRELLPHQRQSSYAASTNGQTHPNAVLLAETLAQRLGRGAIPDLSGILEREPTLRHPQIVRLLRGIGGAGAANALLAHYRKALGLLHPWRDGSESIGRYRYLEQIAGLIGETDPGEARAWRLRYELWKLRHSAQQTFWQFKRTLALLSRSAIKSVGLILSTIVIVTLCLLAALVVLLAQAINRRLILPLRRLWRGRPRV